MRDMHVIKSCTHMYHVYYIFIYLFITPGAGTYIQYICMWPHTVYMTYYAYIHVHMYTMYVYIVYMHIT